MSSTDLQKHVFVSYTAMRFGAAILGITLPFVLWFGGLAIDICRQNSISAYFYASNSSHITMRTWFVGVLFGVSVILGLYRGFSKVEDLLLDAAAVLGVFVTLFPMPWPPRGTENRPGCPFFPTDPHPGIVISIFHRSVPFHVLFAFGFYICLGLISWFCADDTLDLIKEAARKRFYKMAYRVLAIAMPASTAVAFFISHVLRHTNDVFWAEAAGILAFGAYWLTKGFELKETAADDLAAHGKLRLVQGRVEKVEAPVTV